MSRTAGDRRAPRVALVLLTLLTGVVFFDLLFRGRVLYERDISTLFWGQCEAFVNVVASGSWPFWDPYQGFGQPMLANPGAQVFYPLTWLNMFMRPESYYSVYATVHLLLAGAGMLALARTLRLSWTAASAASAVWMLSGPLLSAVDLWQHFAGAAWMPWVVAAAVRALRAPTLPRVLVWSLAQTAQVLTGSLDLVALTALPQIGVLGNRLARRPVAGPARARLVGAALLAALLTVAWTAALWLPAVDLLVRSGRAALPEGGRQLWSVPAVGLLQVLLPVFPEDLPLRTDVRRLLFDGREPLLSSLYLGLPALVLVLAAATSTRRRLAAGGLGLFLLALALALGRHGLAYFWATAVVRQLELLRFPVKTTILAAFAFALLAGLGLDAWREGRVSRRVGAGIAVVVGLCSAGSLTATSALRGSAETWLTPGPQTPLPDGALDAVLGLPTISAAIALGTALLAAVAVATRRRLGQVSMALAVLAVLDLLVAHHGLNPTVPRVYAQTMPAAAAALRSDRPWRVFVFDYLRRPAGKESLRPRQATELLEMSRALRHLTVAQAYPTGLPRFGLRGSYDLDIVGLNPREREGLRLLVIGADREIGPLLRLLQVGGATHIVSLHRKGLEALAPPATFPAPLVGDVHVFRVPDPLPPVSVVGGTRVADGVRAYEALLSPDFDPHEMVLLPSGEPRTAPGDFSATARLEDERADRWSVRVSASAPATVVLPEGYDRDWSATVDGLTTPVLRANVAFRAVPVPAGDHAVTLVYRPSGLVPGVILSLLSIGAALGVLARRRWREARSTGVPEGGGDHGAASPETGS